MVRIGERTGLWVTEEQWHEAHKRLRELFAELHDQAVPPRTEGTLPVAATVMAFELEA